MANTVALIGKPNVGKSTLFNKIIGQKISITDATPGVTRDRIYGKATWAGKFFNLIDTGGIELENRSFQDLIQIQAKVAIEEADVIIFLLDGRAEIDADDFFVVDLLRKSNKKVILAANKLESNQNFDTSIYGLGFDTIFPISAIHGSGIGNLLDEVLNNLDFSKKIDSDAIKLSIIGRPNAGKSTLLNKLTKSNRAIVSEIAGTTRDAIKAEWKIGDINFEIIDTAGIIKKSRIADSIDFYALLRAFKALDEADITLVLIDATQDLSHFDSRVCGFAFEKQKPIILVINKWDLIEKETQTQVEFVKKIQKNYKFIEWAPIVFISGKTGEKVHKLEQKIVDVVQNLNKKIPTSSVNRFLLEILTMQPPRSVAGQRLNIYFGQQVNGKVPTFIFSVNNKKLIHFSYQRYIENQLRKYFGFEGCPLNIIYKNKEKN